MIGLPTPSSSEFPQELSDKEKELLDDTCEGVIKTTYGIPPLCFQQINQAMNESLPLEGFATFPSLPRISEYQRNRYEKRLQKLNNQIGTKPVVNKLLWPPDCILCKTRHQSGWVTRQEPFVSYCIECSNHERLGISVTFWRTREKLFTPIEEYALQHPLVYPPECFLCARTHRIGWKTMKKPYVSYCRDCYPERSSPACQAWTTSESLFKHLN